MSHVEPVGASALGLVALGVADGVDGAVVADQAGVDAAVLVADLVVPAVGVDDALQPLAAAVRVAGEALGAVAERGVLDGDADGAGAAVAGVDAAGVEAGLAVLALLAGLAPHQDGLGCWRQQKRDY